MLDEMSIAGGVLCSSLLVLVFVVIRQRYFSSISDIPGPFLGTFGTCFQIREIFKGRYAEDLTALHEKHGAFVRVSHNEVSINHPEALQNVLGAPMRKGNFYKQFAIPSSKYNNLMAECDPKAHGVMRSRFGAAYAMSNVMKNESHVNDTIQLMEYRLDQLSTHNEPFDLGKWLHFLTWDIMGDVTFSSRFGYLDEGKDVGGSIANTFWLAGYVTLAGYLRWLHMLLLGNPILRWLEVEPNDQAFKTAVRSIEVRKTKADAHSSDMMSFWLGQNAQNPYLLSDKDIFCAVMGNIGAGGDSVGSVLQAFFYFLLKEHPRFLQCLRQEIDAHAASGALSPVVSYSEAQNIPYLQAVLKETLRLWAPVSWSLPRVVPKDGLTVAGRYFAAGTVLSVNPWVIHHSPAYFGGDAHQYNPERWLSDDPALNKQMERFLIPYGLGYNACPGRNLAAIELSKITATLLRDFDFQLANPNGTWKYHTLFLTAQSGWPVWCKRRDAQAEHRAAMELKKSVGTAGKVIAA